MSNPRPNSGWTWLRVLGAGDFAEVHLVERNGTRGAMKIATGQDSSALERLRVEAGALREFSHPSIPELLDVDLESDAPYFVMEVAPGETVLATIEQWNQLGRVHGARETLDFLSQLLNALKAMQGHPKRFVHRDIKDANILIDHESGKASLIDFGFCKPAGEPGIRDKDSFWRAGAARFSPPAKLDDPAIGDVSHDLFAIGVIAYRMLTGTYPWSVSPADGRKAYEQFVRDNPLVMPHHASSFIPLGVSRLVTRMLALGDRERISTTEALDECHRLRSDLSGDRVRNSTLPRSANYPHVVRDAIWGDIRLTTSEYKILNSAEMQRLRWIRQLGMATLVYPTADHSRLSHSIGCVERVEVMMQTIERIEGIRIDVDFRAEARLYALLHDVTHIALGHTLEDQLGMFKRHDENQGRFDRLFDPLSSELGRLLQASDVGRAVWQRLNPDRPPADDAIEQLTASPVGADVLDYIDRDATFCGLDHRVDSAIYRQLRLYSKESLDQPKLISTRSGKYGIRVDRDYAVESLLSERYAMFLKVYTHSAKLAADAVLGKAFAATAGSRAGLKEQAFEWFGDEGLLASLASSRKSIVKECADRLRFRRLPRAVYRGRLIEEPQNLDRTHYYDTLGTLRERGALEFSGRTKIEAEISRHSGVAQDRVFLYLPPKAPGYKRSSLLMQSSDQERPATGDVGEGIARRHLALWEAWVFVAEGTEKEEQAVAESCESALQRANIIEQYRHVLL